MNYQKAERRRHAVTVKGKLDLPILPLPSPLPSPSPPLTMAADDPSPEIPAADSGADLDAFPESFRC